MTVLVIGRSEKVLSEAVDLVRLNGRAAGATNDFDNALTLFDAASLDIVVFGGMVPPDTKEALRPNSPTTNPAIVFVQGLAGIPGLIAAQVEAAAAPSRRGNASVAFDRETRTVALGLDAAAAIRVTGFWGTAFVPPDPASTSATSSRRRLAGACTPCRFPRRFPPSLRSSSCTSTRTSTRSRWARCPAEPR